MDIVERIANDVVGVAKDRMTESHDLVAAIHGVWMEAGLLLGKQMGSIRKMEREEMREG